MIKRDGKKRIFGRTASFLLFFILLLTVCGVKVHAAPPLLLDEADVLTPEQEIALNARLEEVSDTYQIDVVLITVPSLDGKDVLVLAEDRFVYDGYGKSYGSEQLNGVILLHCPAERKYSVTGTGTVQEHMDPADFDKVMDDMIDGMREGASTGDFTAAYNTYIDGIEKNMEGLIGRLLRMSAGSVFLSPIAGFLLSFIYMRRQKRKLTSVRRQSGAGNYVNQAASHLTLSRDVLVNRTVTRTAISRDTGSSDDGYSSTHDHSSGTSFTGGSRDY
ncbi:MAG: TPM domain-containing protein [Lachnospiraceae bacterium]|nr:TPM domain-containing protein [Lachnospiraceae bacterium]